ncbi:unnamed protein product, partial [Haemonchus placei]|uniref:Exonuclease domain-containing protein n=1 Tax=Haemonchus placei TaxID=6290 RepID=A0A0N4WLZ6_HAEPC
GSFVYASTIETNALTPAPVTALCFDPYEELLWFGNCHGRIASYYAPSFERYTAVCATRGDIRDMNATEMVILSLSASELKANTRHGLVAFSSQSMQSLNSMRLLPGTSSLFMGGDQRKLIQFDLEKQKELVINKVQVFEFQTLILVLLQTIQITLRALGTMDTIRVISAHGGAITDFDVNGTKLITSGCSMRLGVPHGDPYVKVYDLRNFSALPPIPLSFAPLFSRFLTLPTFCDSRVFSVGQVNSSGIKVQITIYLFSDHYLSMNYSFFLGNIHVYADRPNPAINDSSYDTDFADPSLGPPQSFLIDDTHTPLASVPLPFSCDDTYFSDWPEEMCQNVYRCFTFSSTSDHRYAPNPRANTPLAYFNVVPYYLDGQEACGMLKPLDSFKFSICFVFVEVEDSPGPFITNGTVELNLLSMLYLQILFHIAALRNVILSHICEDEHCIVCQLDFVFRIISDKRKSKEAAAVSVIHSGKGLSGRRLTSFPSKWMLKIICSSEIYHCRKLPWCLFDDVLVTRVHEDEALHIDPRWKLPLILCYANEKCDVPTSFTSFSMVPMLDIPGEGEYVGIDAEFINLKLMPKALEKSVGRVSCVNSTGEQVLIDDYVVTCEGDVVDDYLTQYSGIMEDDLDPSKSTKHLTTLKRVYMKVLHLIERGCIFVGHALVNDFSTLNIHVPPKQMIDTVELFRVPQQRLFSLQFLAWHLLGEKIQVGIHDSVEDARVALKLFRKWEELNKDGQLGWRVDHAPHSKSSSPLSETPMAGTSPPLE